MPLLLLPMHRHHYLLVDDAVSAGEAHDGRVMPIGRRHSHLILSWWAISIDAAAAVVEEEGAGMTEMNLTMVVMVIAAFSFFSADRNPTRMTEEADGERCRLVVGVA